MFAAAVRAGHWSLALIGVISSVVAAFFYLRVLVLMYMQEPVGEQDEDRSPLPRFALAIPAALTLLLGVFPRGEKPDNPHRATLKEINAAAAKLDDGGKTVKFLDISEKFLQPDGTILKEIMPDFLHLSEKGYQIWADAIKEPLADLLK